MKYCFIIPNYNHIDGFDSLISKLSAYSLPIIVVDDASTESVKSQLLTIAQQNPMVVLCHHRFNQGKGGAVQTGLNKAIELGFSHALQVDADGQHNLQDIDVFLSLSKANPDTLISGCPIYDESVPKHRYYARYITHFWVCVETLSRELKDTMCGFRVYPLEAYDRLSSRSALGKRMDFDIEVMVKLYWQKTPFKFVPTKVHYPENGLSHFNALDDNIRISWMHTRLCFGMLWRSPDLLARFIKRSFSKA
ncbi:glycosyltransferase family 2 protein [Pseudoalteromonas luteoviolacea]|uniref:glycosyltransferase family 2 protein n=1 Tax=Pseudoalteromonas luteoviolacea TaxID=43657 RepID=UPI0011544A13|nr:glycosyltransferase family 2 protein [Pseudoalteromonas luteoviolacea]TQF69595.1 glycosyltransferase family 2 protein [Pseudoalteromonas luteoviolacea]